MSAAETTTNEIPVEQAVRSAVAGLGHWLGRTPEHVRVEEVFPPDYDADDEHACWSVTLSFLEKGAPEPENEMMKQFRGALFPKPPALERVMRVLDIHPTTAQVLRMRVRERRG